MKAYLAVLLFVVIFVQWINPAECKIIPSTWTCSESWYDSDDGCHCNCGAQDPDCNKNLDKTHEYRHTPKSNYWPTNSTQVECTFCSDMICRDAKCYGPCNGQDFLLLNKFSLINRIILIIDTVLLGMLGAGLFGVIFLNCDPGTSRQRHNIEISTHLNQRPDKSILAKVLTLDTVDIKNSFINTGKSIQKKLSFIPGVSSKKKTKPRSVEDEDDVELNEDELLSPLS